MHDPSLVEVYIYALNPDDGEKYYKKIAKSVEHFVPMGHENNINVIAERINADGSACLRNQPRAAARGME
jgi:hypothetical protein